jgi:hypothetical protein
LVADRSVVKDLAGIVEQLNEVNYPLFDALPSTGKGHNIDALDYGLSGNVVFTDVEASLGSEPVYWNTAQGRPCTVKESLEEVSARLVGLDNTVAALNDIAEYDDSALSDGLAELELKVGQVAEDSFGAGYTLNSDGATVLPYSVAEVLDALGGLCEGYLGTGLTHSGTFPSISIARGSVSELDGNLAEIYGAIGLEEGDETIDYSLAGGPWSFTDGMSLAHAMVSVDENLFRQWGERTFEADHLHINTSDTEVNVSFNALSYLGGDETYFQTLDITENVGAHYFSLQVVPPVDEDGRAPSQLQVEVFATFLNPPSAGTVAKLEVYGQNQVPSGPRLLRHGDALNVGHKLLETLTFTYSAVNTLHIATGSMHSIDSTNKGLITLKFKRHFGTIVGDDFDGTLSVLLVKVKWFK